MKLIIIHSGLICATNIYEEMFAFGTIWTVNIYAY